MTGSGKASVLLVDDNPADVRLFKEALKEHGSSLRVDVVENGEDALRYVLREPPFTSISEPALIILDLNLPGLDGREVLARLKSDPELRHIPVIVMTTSEAESDVNHAYDHHANSFVKKPVDMHEFVRVVKACEAFWLDVVQLPTSVE